MTLLDAVDVSDEPSTKHPAISQRAAIEWLVMLAALVAWAGPYARDTGGRGVVGALIMVALAAAAAAYEVALGNFSRVAVAATGLLVAACLAVYFFSPDGKDGGIVLAGYAAAGLILVAVKGFSRSRRRRQAVIVAVMIAGLVEFGEAFLPWWGSEDSAHEMIGTFYWRNPFAAYMAVIAVIGLAVAVWRMRPIQFVGWVTGPIAASAVVFSTSRAALAALALGWLAVGAIALLDSWRMVLRWAAVTLMSVVVVLFLAGPPIFPHRASPFAGTSQRAVQSGQSLSNNTDARVIFWHESIPVIKAHPVFGTGFNEFGAAGVQLFEAPEGRTPFVHNSFLQPWVDGGLILGGAFTIVIVATLIALVRRRKIFQRRGHDGLPWSAVAIAAGVACAHAFVDFDWTYPATLVLVSILIGLLLSAPDKAEIDAAESVSIRRGGSVTNSWTKVMAVLAVGVIGATGLLSILGYRATSGVLASPTSTLFQRVRSADSWPLSGDQADVQLLRRAPSVAAVNYALARTKRQATVDPELQLTRAGAEIQIGRDAAAIAIIRGVQARLGMLNAPMVQGEAPLLVAAHDPADGVDLMTRQLANDVGAHVGIPGSVLPQQAWSDLFTFVRFAPTTKQVACDAAAITTRIGPPPAGSPRLPRADRASQCPAGQEAGES